MKVRGLKQVFHWLFLAVGLFSLIMLAITVNTYLGYAEEGYGLKMSFEDAWLNDNWLILSFDIENPGGLEIEIIDGNITLSQIYVIPNSRPNDPLQQLPSPLPARESTPIIIWIPISDPDLGNIQTSGQVELDLELLLYVPERDMSTEITYQATVEVEL